jgi:transcriptional regulator with XRE-family HTH domain
VTIGDRIKKLRGYKTRDELSNLLKIHKNTLANYETGTRIPDANFLLQLLEVYPDISAKWLLTGVGPENKEVEIEFDKEMFIEIIEAVDEMTSPDDSLRSKVEVAFSYYGFFTAGGIRATRKDVISLADFSKNLTNKLGELGGFEKVKESGIMNLIKIIESMQETN